MNFLGNRSAGARPRYRPTGREKRVYPNIGIHGKAIQKRFRIILPGRGLSRLFLFERRARVDKKEIVMFYGPFFRRCVFFILAPFMIPACRAAAVAEKEPNDSFAAPQFVEVGRVVRGNLANAGDADIFALRFTRPAWIGARAQALKDTDIRVELYSSSGLLFVSDSAPLQGAEAIAPVWITNASLQAGQPDDCFARVVSADGRPGEYELEFLNGVNPPGDPESEPNNDPTRAMRLPIGPDGEGIVSGYFHTGEGYARKSGGVPAADLDYFRLRAPATPEKSWLFSGKLATGPGNNALLRFLRSDGATDEEFYMADDFGAGAGESWENILLPDDGMTLQISDSVGIGGKNEPYELRYRLRPWDGRVEYEPNNDPTRALPLERIFAARQSRASATARIPDTAPDSPAQNPPAPKKKPRAYRKAALNGDLPGGQDRDYFILRGADMPGKSARLVWNFPVPPSGDWQMRLLDQERRVAREIPLRGIKKLALDDLSGDKPWVLYIGLRTARKNDAGFAYSLDMAEAKRQNGREAEPNDTLEMSSPIGKDISVSGQLSHTKDIDFWSIASNAKFAHLRLQALEGPDWRMGFFDKSGRLLSDNASLSPDANASIAIPAGTRYLKIAAEKIPGETGAPYEIRFD